MNAMYWMIPVALLILSVAIAVVLVKKGMKPRKALSIHFLSLVAIVAVSVAMPLFGTAAPAEDSGANTAAAEQQEEAAAPADNGLKYIGAALAVGLAGIGGGIAVASGASAAIGATAEDPKNFGKSIIFVALGEGFGLYGLLIAILCLVLQ